MCKRRRQKIAYRAHYGRPVMHEFGIVRIYQACSEDAHLGPDNEHVVR